MEEEELQEERKMDEGEELVEHKLWFLILCPSLVLSSPGQISSGLQHCCVAQRKAPEKSWVTSKLLPFIYTLHKNIDQKGI